MHARVTTFQMANGGLEKLVAAINAHDITRVEGNRGAYLLVNRDSNEVMTITLWESEQALQDALPIARQIIGGAAEHVVGEPSRAVFEVASSA